MSDTVGSLAWGRRTRGLLGRRDRLALVLGAVRDQMATTLRALGRTPALGRIDLDRIPVPDSSVARLAEERCRELCGECLLNHCCRTYYWAAILAQVDGTAHDPEMLYVAALLHDLGLSAPYATSPQQCCFAVAGAEGALDVLRHTDWPAERARTVAEAIALHLNVAPVPVRAGAEAHLLRTGAVCDVIGARYRELPGTTVADVLARYPRRDFKATFTAQLHAEAQARPGTRVALMDGPLQLGRMIRRAPFDE